MVAQIDRVMLKKRPGKIPGRLVCWSLIEGRPLTTKGRWINPLVLALLRAAQAVPARKGSDAPIYIVGNGRSGTTILGKLFALHCDTVFLNEPKAVWECAYGKDDLFGEYSLGAARVRLEATDARPHTSRKLERIYSWAMRWGRATRVVEKYPEHIYRIPFVVELFPKARFVAILRDGVETCSSIAKWSERERDAKGAEVHDWWGRNGRKWHLLVEQLVPAYPDLAPLAAVLRNTTDDRDRAAVEWIVSTREALKASALHGDRLLTIGYEELCARPAEVLKRITAHCGLSADPVCADYAESVLALADEHGELPLMPELVEPFRETLRSSGYAASLERVIVRPGPVR